MRVKVSRRRTGVRFTGRVSIHLTRPELAKLERELVARDPVSGTVRIPVSVMDLAVARVNRPDWVLSLGGLIDSNQFFYAHPMLDRETAEPGGRRSG